LSNECPDRGNASASAADYSALKLMICIPAFNEEKTIAEVVKGAKKFTSDVVVYDDGSVDNTHLCARNAGATIIRHPKNKGYGAAIKALFVDAKTRNAEIMITIDSDGQHDVSQIPKLLEPILRGEADIVIGSRFLNRDSIEMVPLYRKLGIKVITNVTKRASDSNITDAQSGFRAYNRKAISELDLTEDGMGISTEILIRAHQNGLVIKEVPIIIRYDVEYPFTQNPVVHGLDVFTKAVQMLSFKRPLLFYGLPGICLLVGAAIIAGFSLEIYSQTRYVSTNMILISVALALIGIILIVTGCIVYTLIALFKGRIKNVQ
jgi:glycosyltransferase involved in cell wall biosynthesis